MNEVLSRVAQEQAEAFLTGPASLLVENTVAPNPLSSINYEVHFRPVPNFAFDVMVLTVRCETPQLDISQLM